MTAAELKVFQAIAEAERQRIRERIEKVERLDLGYGDSLLIEAPGGRWVRLADVLRAVEEEE